MSSKKISNTKKPLRNSNSKFLATQTTKTMQINMSTLSTAQKMLCIKLLAESNINFQKDSDGFQAQLKIDPNKLTTQFKINQKQQTQNYKQINKVSPIKKRDLQQYKEINKKKKLPQTHNKQNIKKNNQNKQRSVSPIVKKSVQNLYTSSKKCLSKTVKINQLTKLLSLHPSVQLYIYPKKMTFQSLIQFIQTVYQMYWRKQINNNNNAQKKQKYINKNDNHNQENQNQNNFCQWVYSHFIVNEKQKMKIQQTLVNLIQSLNHFSYKSLGVELFYNFLSGIYHQDSLRYFLVIRAVLQQIYNDKIIDKVSNYASKTGIVYKMKMNPFDKLIQEEKVHSFLDICCCDLDKSQKGTDNIIEKIFNQMTEKMFYDEKKKKNFIQFHQMCQILLREFTKKQKGNLSNLELSYTKNQNDTINQNFNQIQQNTLNFDDQQLQLTYSVHEQNQIQEQQDMYKQNQSSNLNAYLPIEAFQQLSVKPKLNQDTFQIKFQKQVRKKYQQICMIFSNNQKLCQTYNKADQILQVLLQTINKCDKNKWLQFLKTKKINNLRENQQLYFIQKLQIQFKNMKRANFITKQSLNKIFTASYLRQTILQVYSPLLNNKNQIY